MRKSSDRQRGLAIQPVRRMVTSAAAAPYHLCQLLELRVSAHAQCSCGSPARRYCWVAASDRKRVVPEVTSFVAMTSSSAAGAGRYAVVARYLASLEMAGNELESPPGASSGRDPDRQAPARKPQVDDDDVTRDSDKTPAPRQVL